MILYIDKKEPNDIGGATTDKRKAEYILAKHGLSFEKILAQSPKHGFPAGAFRSGRYILIFNMGWDLSFVNFAFINHKLDLDKHLDVFADSFSPKTVQAFHDLKKIIQEQPQSELNKVELSDDDAEFDVVYFLYKGYSDHNSFLN